MSLARIALAAAAMLAFAGDASARQAGYVYLQCDFVGEEAGNPPARFRIGNGQWHSLRDGGWAQTGGAECGGEEPVSTGGMARTRCTFGETEFRMVTEYSGRYPSTYTTTINRMTGRYLLTVREADGLAPDDDNAQCRSIPEPATAQRKF